MNHTFRMILFLESGTMVKQSRSSSSPSLPSDSPTPKRWAISTDNKENHNLPGRPSLDPQHGPMKGSSIIERKNLWRGKDTKSAWPGVQQLVSAGLRQRVVVAVTQRGRLETQTQRNQLNLTKGSPQQELYLDMKLRWRNWQRPVWKVCVNFSRRHQTNRMDVGSQLIGILGAVKPKRQLLHATKPPLLKSLKMQKPSFLHFLWFL